MTPLQTLLNALGWSRGYAAGRIGVSGSTMRYWCDGANTRGNPSQAPAWAFEYFRDCLRAVERVPVKKPERVQD